MVQHPRNANEGKVVGQVPSLTGIKARHVPIWLWGYLDCASPD